MQNWQYYDTALPSGNCGIYFGIYIFETFSGNSCVKYEKNKTYLVVVCHMRKFKTKNPGSTLCIYNPNSYTKKCIPYTNYLKLKSSKLNINKYNSQKC